MEVLGWTIEEPLKEATIRYPLCPGHWQKLSKNVRRMADCQRHQEVQKALAEIPPRDYPKGFSKEKFFLRHAGALRGAAKALEIIGKIEAAMAQPRGEPFYTAWKHLFMTLQGGFNLLHQKASRQGDWVDMKPICQNKKCGTLDAIKSGRLLTVARERNDASSTFFNQEGTPATVHMNTWISLLNKDWCRSCAERIMEDLELMHKLHCRPEVIAAFAHQPTADAFRNWLGIWRSLAALRKLRELWIKLARETGCEDIPDTSVGDAILSFKRLRELHATWAAQAAPSSPNELAELEAMELDEILRQEVDTEGQEDLYRAYQPSAPQEPEDLKAPEIAAHPEASKEPPRAEVPQELSKAEPDRARARVPLRSGGDLAILPKVGNKGLLKRSEGNKQPNNVRL